jgi:5-formyltetrahydrofolate cyclo-ligase
MLKKDIRKAYRDKREQLDKLRLPMLEDMILENFKRLELPKLHMIHRYMPGQGMHEPDPGPLCEWLSFHNPGMTQVLPRVDMLSNEMSGIIINGRTELVMNKWGIPEPSEGNEADPESIDLVLIPLLAFDLSGHRVGYGKGFYDRFLRNCRPDCIKAGLSFFGPVESIDDLNVFDRKMDLCITPERVYEFQ